MKSIKCYFAPFLALAAVCNLLPAGSIALTGNAENGLIVEENFEMRASFVADATHTAAYSTTDAVAWNDAIQALSQLSWRLRRWGRNRCGIRTFLNTNFQNA